MAKVLRLLLVVAALLAGGTASGRAAESAAVQSTRATASLVTDTDTVAPGHPIRAALRLRLAPGWHTYWRNPGDAGVAPDLSFTLPPGVTAGPVSWPAPVRESEGPLTTYAYTGEVLLPVTLHGASGPTTIQLNAEWLVCSNICVPESGVFQLSLAAGDGAPSAEAGLFARTDARIPRASPWPARIAPDGTLAVLGLTGARDAWFAPEQPGQIVPGAPQRMTQTAQGLLLHLQREPDFQPAAALPGVLTVQDASGTPSYLHLVAVPGAVPPAESGGVVAVPAGLWRMLGLALLGGLVLNLMPCVFPVLALKTVGLAGLAGARRRAAALHAGSYAAGVLVAFGALGGGLVLARAAGVAAGWGFQFQHPGFVAVIAWVLFATGLNLSGVFSIGGRFAGVGQDYAAREGVGGSFATGLLAVVVATPCTAPFMAAAIAGALVAPPATALAVFLTMGMGLALPYVVLALIPGVARALPRPGRWMEVLRQALAFPMYAAAAWLVWVMSQEAGPSGVLATLAGAVLIALAAWAIGMAEGAQRRGRRLGRVVAAVAVLGALAVLPAIGATPAPAAAPSAERAEEAFSASRLAALVKAGRPVFVEATAAWCITCKVNERLALTPRVRAAFAARGITCLVADWTRQDAEITAFLRAHGHAGVPLYVFFPGGGRTPVVLPQILTEALVLDAIGAPAT